MPYQPCSFVARHQDGFDSGCCSRYALWVPGEAAGCTAHQTFQQARGARYSPRTICTWHGDDVHNRPHTLVCVALLVVLPSQPDPRVCLVWHPSWAVFCARADIWEGLGPCCLESCSTRKLRDYSFSRCPNLGAQPMHQTQNSCRCQPPTINTCRDSDTLDALYLTSCNLVRFVCAIMSPARCHQSLTDCQIRRVTRCFVYVATPCCTPLIHCRLLCSPPISPYPQMCKLDCSQLVRQLQTIRTTSKGFMEKRCVFKLLR